MLAEAVGEISPGFEATDVMPALGRATVRPAGQRRLAWAIVNQPPC